jgi:hypothetical protein
MHCFHQSGGFMSPRKYALSVLDHCTRLRWIVDPGAPKSIKYEAVPEPGITALPFPVPEAFCLKSLSKSLQAVVLLMEIEPETGSFRHSEKPSAPMVTEVDPTGIDGTPDSEW